MNVDIEAWVRLANNLQCTRSHTMRTFLLPRMYALHTQIPVEVRTTFIPQRRRSGREKVEEWSEAISASSRVRPKCREWEGGQGCSSVEALTSTTQLLSQLIDGRRNRRRRLDGRTQRSRRVFGVIVVAKIYNKVEGQEKSITIFSFEGITVLDSY